MPTATYSVHCPRPDIKKVTPQPIPQEIANRMNFASCIATLYDMAVKEGVVK